MIQFRQKQYTIEEGHYTGPKDIENVPGYLEMMGKGVLTSHIASAGLGVGKELYEQSKGLSGRPQGSVVGAAWDGWTDKRATLLGLGAGILAKAALNAIHNPMTSVKFNEVDRNLRARFGMFQMSGFTVGDTRDRRGKMDEKFSINDRDVTSYKINLAIQDDKVTMYTLGLTSEELKALNKILDYYCKKYHGMDYRSGVLGASSKENSYYIEIIFTNYQILCDFLGEVSDTLMVKINLLDSKAIVENKLSSDQRSFSFSTPALNKLEVLEILGKSGISTGKVLLTNSGSIPETILGSIISALQKFSSSEEALIAKGKVRKGDLGNRYLEVALKELGYIETIHYSVGEKKVPLNMYLHKGDLIICISKRGTDIKKFNKVFDSENFFSKRDLGEVVVCTYPMKSKDELKVVLRKLIGSGLTPNIYIV